MYAKLALWSLVAVGSAALAAPAQTQTPSDDDVRVVRTPGVARTLTVTAQTAAPSPRPDVRVGGMGAASSGGSYSWDTNYGGMTRVNRMFVTDDAGHETDQLVRQLAEAKSDSERDKLKDKLGEVLQKQFEQRQKRHEAEIAELEAQIKKLKDLVAKRQENHREIIARRLEQVVRESQGLGW